MAFGRSGGGLLASEQGELEETSLDRERLGEAEDPTHGGQGFVVAPITAPREVYSYDVAKLVHTAQVSFKLLAFRHVEAKSYQVHQLLRDIEEFHLTMEE